MADTKKTYMSGKDVLIKPDGSTYHLGTKKGDVHPRILTVGSAARAQTVAKHLDKGTVKEFHSSRDMHTYSGMYKGVGVSIIAIGMGAPMMDFMLREGTYCEEGPMSVIRFGTCGIFNKDVLPGTMMTAGKGSMYAYVNYAHFTGCSNDKTVGQQSVPYLLSNPVPADKELNDEVIKQLKAVGCDTFDGLNACGETFYSCQGRKDPHFNDKNESILEDIKNAGVDWVEMETHQLFHLASVRKVKCKVTACAIGLLNRVNDSITENITEDKLHELESTAGKACLDAIISVKL